MINRFKLALAGLAAAGAALVATPEPAKAGGFSISFGFGHPGYHSYGYAPAYYGWGHPVYYRPRVRRVVYAYPRYYHRPVVRRVVYSYPRYHYYPRHRVRYVSYGYRPYYGHRWGHRHHGWGHRRHWW